MEGQEQLPLEERQELRRESASWWINRGRILLGSRLHDSRVPCPDCKTTTGVLIPRGGQNTVRCAECGRLLYNAPKTETGEKARTVETLRRQIKPSQQARILDRDHARCVLCGRGDVPLTIGHLLSIADGYRLGATAQELAEDVNLAAMCEACNAGLGDRSVLPATYARITYNLLLATQHADGHLTSGSPIDAATNASPSMSGGGDVEHEADNWADDLSFSNVAPPGRGDAN